MLRGRKWFVLLAGLAMAAVGSPRAVAAQGATTGAIGGIVTDETGAPIEQAQIVVTNRASGAVTGSITRSNGRYIVQGLDVGGPYSVTARRLGYTPQTKDSIYVSLGQTVRLDLQMPHQAAVLSNVVVTAEADPNFSRTKTGVGTNISDSLLHRLPTLDRNFTDFVKMTPQVSVAGPGNSGGGVNNRFNNIQIDGASENDLFGLGTTGQPGGQAGGKSISIEAVKEYQILLSPFDVRQGSFAGMLINAVTKSGTNEFHGSAYGFTRNENLAANVPYIRNQPYDNNKYGFSLGGPIVKDKIHFFIAPEFQRLSQPASGPYLGQPAGSPVPVQVYDSSVTRMTSILQGYGINPGTAGKITDENPLTNFFGRLDFQLPGNSRLVLRHNYGSANQDIFSRSNSLSGATYAMSSNGYFFESKKNATVGQLYTNFASGAYNELIVGYNTINDDRTPNVTAPQITVSVPNAAGSGQTRIVSGAEQFSQGNSLDQAITELTDNYSWNLGSGHRVTLGTHNEWYKIDNLFTESSFGVWTFNSLDSLQNGIASTYRISAMINPALSEHAKFNAAQYGIYLEDQWQTTDRLTLTYGLRLDDPVMNDKPPFAPVVDSLFGRNTSVVPSGNILWSPRLGFNWDINGDQTHQLRGGLGLFAGRPPFVWLGNSFQNSGMGLGFVNCSSSASAPGPAPQFTTDSVPTACANGNGLATGVVGPVDLMDKNLKMPQNFRASLGWDKQLASGYVVTLEGLYTKAVSNFFYVNRNLKAPIGTDRNGRVMYGTIGGTGVSAPQLVSNRFSEVIDIVNQNKDYSYDLTAQLRKQFTTRFQAQASYTYSHSYDVQTLTSSRAISNWQFGRELAGNHLSKDLTTSIFDQPHKVQASATYSFPTRTDLSFLYLGQSGPPFDYVYGGFSGTGDLNADGKQGNDLIYVPKNAYDTAEVFFSGTPQSVATQQAALERFIRSSKCLSSQRGRIMERNSCRSPWENELDLSLRQSVPSYFSGHALSVQMDIFNVLNLMDNRWGRFRYASSFNNVNLLTQTGERNAGNVATEEPVVTFNPSQQQFTSDNRSSYYQIQFSARYSF